MVEGRRVEKKDLIDPNNTRRYYYNYKWQVLAEYNGSGVFQRWFAYGNYIDEVLMMGTTASPASAMFYIHDHLYSPAVLTNWLGTILERYEYDAYGNCYVLEPNFAPDSDGRSNYGNPYLFTGRRVDILDSGSLKLQYSRNRYYDYYSGRWLTHDPLGITPNTQKPNKYDVVGQYRNGLSLYEYVGSDPQGHLDPRGLEILEPATCPGRISDPDMEKDDFMVVWRSVWTPFSWSPIDPWTLTPIFGWYVSEYRSVNYKVKGWSGVTINIAAGGECSELVSIFWESWNKPNYHEVVEKHRDCGGVWQSYGRPCKAYFKCKQKCCYTKKRKWGIQWKTTKVGVLAWSDLGGVPYCNVGTDPKEICWEYYFKCLTCNIPN